MFWKPTLRYCSPASGGRNGTVDVQNRRAETAQQESSRRGAVEIRDASFWFLPAAPANPNASVDQTRRPNRRRQGADEILPVEDILYAKKDLDVPADVPLG